MPIKRLDKARASLPAGYQYGDAAPPRVPKLSDPDWMDYFEAHYVQPMREMYADPVKQAAYRARVDAALKSPAEVARAAEMQQRWRDKYHAPYGAQLGRPAACR